jgi:hypothetical protein
MELRFDTPSKRGFTDEGPLNAGGGDGLKIWRVAVNILNKQSRTTDKEWSPAWGLGDGLTTPRRKNQLVTKCQTGPRIWTTFGTRNVTSFYSTDSPKTAASEMPRITQILWQYKRSDGMRMAVGQQTILGFSMEMLIIT